MLKTSGSYLKAVTVQTDNFDGIKEATGSNCNKVRFGSEFCEWKIPSLNMLKKAYALANERRKEFAYVTPRFSENSLKRIGKQLDFLNKKGTDIIINDLGMLNILERHSNLRPHLGRQLIHIPARCPWKEIIEWEGFFARRKAAKIFYQTSLNYKPTINFLRKNGVEDVDVDWIPRCFPYYDFLVKNQLNLAIHLHLIPVTVTRRCHTARILGEKKPEGCSKPCKKRAFLLKHRMLGIELYLHGNAVFSLIQPSRRDVKELCKHGINEFVITMNPITKIENQKTINTLIRNMFQS